ncbi:sushi, nidogen and EGF-like domain-containing protein 1 [Clupea harengus]|uniref:Sushi, nidogen and EGF-like domain-containing protein 1 n=1 Tax=Clupea harengus TaxID=7950 RepID=A0A6P3W706_CLUHA|nr:sushi, nidogen and EGF-like domain-containing protein 1 [Clupea harengus]
MARQGVFYPFGPGDSYSARADDGWAFTNIAQPFTYFGYTSSQIYVNSNGFLTFDSGSSRYSPYRFPGGTRNIVSPFWTDLENRYSGTISYREYNSGSVLQQASTDINLYFPGISFSASWVFVATWDKVEYYWSSGTEISFQVVLISDYERSFTLMNYGAISATGLNVQAGYDTIKSTHHFSIPGSFMSNITDFRNTSNVNRPGRWAFQINGL